MNDKLRRRAALALASGLVGVGCAGTMPAALYCPTVEAPYHYPEKAWTSATEGTVEIERCPVGTGFPPLTVVSGPKVLADSILVDLENELKLQPSRPNAPHTCRRELFHFKITPTEADVLVAESPPSTLVTRGYERPQIVSRGSIADAIPEDKWVGGVVKVRAVVDPDGVVKEAVLVEGTKTEVDALVVDWVKTFRFCPARLRGQRVAAPFVFAAELRP
jgi:TonB family protein